jgi:hypothetical protein
VARVRIFYRVVKTNPPTRDDFRSYLALGKPLLNPTPRRLRAWAGVSVYDTEVTASAKAQDFNLGPFVAELNVPDDAPIEAEGPGQSGHYNLYGDPDDLLQFVVSVRRI